MEETRGCREKEGEKREKTMAEKEEEKAFE